MRSPAEARLGKLLVQEGLISDVQLQAALAAQSAAGVYVPLGRLLVERKIVTARQLQLVLERSEKRLRLGEVLLRNGSITEEKLQQALAQQQRLQRPLGEVLVKLGFITDEVMRQALGLQLNIPFVDLDRINPDRNLTRLINSNYARRHLLVPVARVGQMLTICMNDPTTGAVIEELAASSGYIVNVVTSSQEAIKRAFKRLYEQPVDSGTVVVPDAAAAASVETIAVKEDDGEEPKSKYVEETGQRADHIVRQILALALERRCSDIHLEMLASRMHIRFRIDGVLQELDLGSFKDTCDQNAREIISRIKVLAKLDIAERRRPQDGAFRVRMDRQGEPVHVDFRVSVLPGYYGESCVLRILDKKNAPTSIERLGFSAAITSKLHELVKRPAGMLLITGPTGSGKSTTLYAALMTTYKPEIRVLTAEDPIEYVYEQFSQSEVNERIGNTFARYLRAFLRHDPEVIMIGEIRDEETAEMAFRAAQTGHLLLSTLHTNDAISAVTRLLDLKVDPNLVTSSLLGVLAQRLVREVCSACRSEYTPGPDLVREFFTTLPVDFKFYRGEGCKLCNFSGYRGRTSVAELWVPNEQDIILINKSAPMDEIRTSARQSTVSMAHDVMDRLAAGRTNLEELIRVMPYSSVYQFRQAVTAGFRPPSSARPA
jgi:type IV pilus assembly protein PilB